MSGHHLCIILRDADNFGSVVVGGTGVSGGSES